MCTKWIHTSSGNPVQVLYKYQLHDGVAVNFLINLLFTGMSRYLINITVLATACSKSVVPFLSMTILIVHKQ